jgi:hypothetical protein
MVLKSPYHISLNLSLNINCAEVDKCERYHLVVEKERPLLKPRHYL